jgi:peptide/nickel transport system ATP-binding protein
VSDQPLLSIKNLTISYETKSGTLLAVDRTNLNIGKNTFIAVVGESGCGKSTLALSIIGLLLSPPAKVNSGIMEYKSIDLLGLDEKQRRGYRGTEIAMIFQEPLTSLNPVYRVGDQIAEAVMVREVRKGTGSISSTDTDVMQKMYSTKASYLPSRLPKPRHGLAKRLRNEIIQALKLVRIADAEQVIDRYPFELSGGMRQRIMIAMALAEKPALLVADEPTTALDVTTQAQVLKLMKELMKEVQTSILLITHDLAVASQVADRIVVMYAGDVVEDANVYDFFSEPLHPYSQALLACIPSGSKDKNPLKAIPGTVPDLRKPLIGCKFASRCPHVMKVCYDKSPSLIETKSNHRVACFLYGE